MRNKMSGSCEGDYILERTCGLGCPCRFGEFNTHLNLVRNDMKTEPSSSEGIDPPALIPERKHINVRGREEHEAVLKDAKLCQELGLDQVYETLVYLKRWGSWLSKD
jgi:hypothetical protein